MRSTMFLLMGIAGCLVPGDETGRTDTGEYTPCDAGADLSVEGESFAGEVPFGLTLTHADGEAATVAVTWSDDEGDTWQDATLDQSLESLGTTAEGVLYERTWDAWTDLGAEAATIRLKAVARSDCGLWPRATVSGLAVDNSQLTGPECEITADDLEGPYDGPVTVWFTVSHESSSAVFVDAEWADTAGGGGDTGSEGAWESVERLSDDCDEDGRADTLTDLETSAEGERHCFTWDTLDTFSDDREVRLRLSCGVGFEVHDEVTTDTFEVNNDPDPDAGELRLTELLPGASSSDGDYIELYNATDHYLDLQGVRVERWKDSDVGSSTATSSFDIDHITETVIVDPGGYFVLAGSDDPLEAGCVEADMAWGDAFTLNDDSVVAVSLGSTEILEVDFRESAGFSFEEGVAWSLDPGCYAEAEWYDVSCWCEETASVESCDSDVDASRGSPHEATDACE